MASLALVVSVILLASILIGPISYMISSLVPQWLSWMLGAVCVAVGVWAVMVPVPVLQIIGLVDLGIGLKILLSGKGNTTQG